MSDRRRRVDLREPLEDPLTGTAVLALGGNALSREDQEGTIEEQYGNALAMARSVRSLIADGWRVVIVHGNGPQVGNLAIQQEGSAALVPAQPLFALGAMTQGALGSLICLALREVCGDEIPGAVSVITHVVVEPDDPAFDRPTKPIGPFFTEAEAEGFMRDRDWTMVEDSGRGFRRVVPSPRPVDILEAGPISRLIDAGYVVVAAGGGGIPVTRTADGTIRGIEAVIDKDLAAEQIAEAADADALALVTGIPTVRLDFGTPNERAVTELDVAEARRHLDEGQFPPGSMGPKITAACAFVEGGDRIAAITTPELVYATLRPTDDGPDGERGTRIVPTTSHAEVSAS